MSWITNPVSVGADQLTVGSWQRMVTASAEKLTVKAFTVDESKVFTPHHPKWISRSTQWWACTQPERPRDSEILFDEDCAACIMKARLVLTVEGDYVGRYRGKSDGDYRMALSLRSWLDEVDAASV